jgi:hypothetical protein
MSEVSRKNKEPGRVAAIWRTATVLLLGVVIGMAVLSSAVAGTMGKQTILGKLHTYVRPASISPLHSLETVSKCPPGSVAITGGIDFDTGSPNVLIPWNGPLVGSHNLIDAGPGRFGPPTAWRARVIDLSPTQGYSYAVAVVCASLEHN